MKETAAKLTVLFDNLFWVGLYERWSGGKYEACKIVFGAEPKDYDVYAFLLENWDKLRFSPATAAEDGEPGERLNPKRAQREARRQVSASGVGTKAQQALQAQREESKTERKVKSKEQREAEEERKFDGRQEQRRGSHGGR